MNALETQFNGQLFRSRLEARWAIFFWLLKIEYQYEPEGYRLVDGTQYVPDFYLPRFDCRDGLFVEVKPENDPFDKARVFGRERSILLLDGPPAVKAYVICHPSFYEELKELPQEELLPEEIGLMPGTYEACFSTKYLPGSSHGNEYRMFSAPCDSDIGLYAPTEAIDLVRSARFENGSFVGFGRLRYGRPQWDRSASIRIDR
jgi:hypothetical protein